MPIEPHHHHQHTTDEPSKPTPPPTLAPTTWPTILRPPLLLAMLPALTLHTFTSPLRKLWSATCTLLQTIITSTAQPAPSEHPPIYSPNLQYGFLQGTFGLPYGGYLVHPPGALPPTLNLTQKMPMFGAIGRRDEICALLRSMHTMVFSQMAARTYTADIVIEVYPVNRSAAWRVPRWLDFAGANAPRQLVIRAGRTFVPADFDPLLSIRAPQGISMREIAEVLMQSWNRRTVDLTRDKALNISLMGRSRSAQLADLDDENDDHRAFSSDDNFTLPPYHHHAHQNWPQASRGSSSEPPPAYSSLHHQ